MSLDEVVNMAGLEVIHPRGGSGGILPQEILMILGVLGRILVHSEVYREARRASREEAHHRMKQI